MFLQGDRVDPGGPFTEVGRPGEGVVRGREFKGGDDTFDLGSAQLHRIQARPLKHVLRPHSDTVRDN